MWSKRESSSAGEELNKVIDKVRTHIWMHISEFRLPYSISFFIKCHKLNSLMASMKSSYRIHEHNSDNNDNNINFDKLNNYNYNYYTYKYVG